MLKDHKFYMNIALQQASKALKQNEVPIGAIVINSSTGEIISKAYNKVITQNNVSAHAEMLAIIYACKKSKNYRLNGYNLYTTLEPCAMCAGAIIHSRLDHVFFGAFDKKGGSIVNNAKLFSEKFNYNYKPKWEGGICKDESADLLREFFKKLREK